MARRFNPPPGWPQPPPEWQPLPGWRPDPRWPAPPPDWQLWVDDPGDQPEGSAEAPQPQPQPRPVRPARQGASPTAPVTRSWPHAAFALVRRRPGWTVVGVFFLLGAFGGLGSAFLLGGLAGLGWAIVAFLRSRGKNATAPRRGRSALIGAAGLTAVIAGAAISPAPPAQVAAPAPAASTTAADPTPAATTPTPPAPSSQTPTPTPTTSTVTPTPTASTVTPTPRPPATSTGPTAPPKPPPQAGTALAVVTGLIVKGRAAKTGYSRDRFGDGWSSIPGGCDTRQTVLLRDLDDLKVQAADRCSVLGGSLNDPYTGAKLKVTVTTVGDYDADHMVSLSDAWQKGAQQWPAEKRVSFANDLLNLRTTLGSVNASKGDSDAASWLPPNASYRCAFIARQVTVKAKYALTVTAAEKAAMTRVLERCPNQQPTTPDQARKVTDPTPTVVKPAPKPQPQPEPQPKPEPPPKPEPEPPPEPATDPQFPTCKAAKSAGYGPYVRGSDPEYDWYRDSDGDGTVCES